MDKDKFYLEIINHLQDGVYFVDTQRQIRFWNRAAERITGYTAAEIINKCCQNSGLNHIDLEGHPLCHLGCPLFSTLVDGKHRTHQVLLRHKEGYRIPILVNISPIYHQGEILGAVEIFTPKNAMVYDDDLIDHLSNEAMHDPLTKLPNRRYLTSFLSYRIEEYKRFGRVFAVTFADIDNFSNINNTYGHDAGDKVLHTIAQTLKQNLRKDDMYGRWGGEEFVGVHMISASKECVGLGQRFCTLIQNTEIIYPPHTLQVTVSLGATIVNDQDDVDSIIRRADNLMYLSKQGGKNQMHCDSVP